mgnify:CR=1 FL=1|tara:strand:+ start:605 stop:787 length:183 start_codon:yes stop_codon:yes gene_type:complete
MGAGDIISPGNQILALTAKKATPKSPTMAIGRIFVLIKLTLLLSNLIYISSKIKFLKYLF